MTTFNVNNHSPNLGIEGDDFDRHLGFLNECVNMVTQYSGSPPLYGGVGIYTTIAITPKHRYSYSTLQMLTQFDFQIV